MGEKSTPSFSRLLEFFISCSLTALIIYTLVVAKELLIPFVIAIVIWYLIASTAMAIRKTSFWGWHIPYPFALLIAFLIAFLLLGATTHIISQNIAILLQSLPQYQSKLEKMFHEGMNHWGATNPVDFSDFLKDFSLLSVATSMAQLMTLIASNMGIILIYVLLLFLEQRSFNSKLRALIKDSDQYLSIHNLILHISSQIQSYIRIKTLISFVTALACYVIFKFVGIDFAEFWALLVFLLNYIPTIGSVFATIFPCLLAIVQFDTWYPFFILVVLLTTLHFVIGNVIEPRLVGKTMNLSSLAIILSLAVWGQIWGLVGMFLCVPFMVMINIVLANFKKTRPLAIILSQKGDLGEVE